MSDVGPTLMLMIPTQTSAFLCVCVYNFLCIFSSAKAWWQICLNSSNRKKQKHTNDTNILSYKVVIFPIYKMYINNIDKFVIIFWYARFCIGPCIMSPSGRGWGLHSSSRRCPFVTFTGLSRGEREGDRERRGEREVERKGLLCHLHRHCGLRYSVQKSLWLMILPGMNRKGMKCEISHFMYRQCSVNSTLPVKWKE